MNFLTILLAIALAISLFVNYMASRKIKAQEARNAHLQRLLELQSKVKDGTLDVG